MQEPASILEEPSVIFENTDFLAVNKPPGLMVHGVRISSKRRVDEERAKEPTLVDWLLKRYPEIKNVGDEPTLRPGIVHRLDKETSGVMLVAKTQASFEHLKSLFQKHEIKKTYEALVIGIPKNEQGIIDAPIGIKNGSLKRSIHVAKMAKDAVTEYRVIKKYPGSEGAKGYSLLKVMPRTGRTHQIRVHLASMGHPIVGDRLYGGKKQPSFAHRLMLHAASIEFSDGAGNKFKFDAHLSTPAFAPHGVSLRYEE